MNSEIEQAPSKRLTFGIQKSGRLSANTTKILIEAGIDFERPNNILRSRAQNFPLDLLYLRDDDIPPYVADGVLDIAIVGYDTIAEQDAQVDILEKLDFGFCRLSLAIPRNEEYLGIQSFNGKRIATSFPSLVRKFLDKHKVKAEIHEISGSVEIAPSIGLSDVICDLVSTGSTLLSNGLKEVEVVFKSQAVLISNKKPGKEAQEIIDKLVFRIHSVQKARKKKYILLNTPNSSIEKISNLLPGIKSPTVMPLAQPGWSSLHAVVDEGSFWEVIEPIKSAGAEGILVLPIERIVE